MDKVEQQQARDREEAAFRAGHRLGVTGYPWITVDEGWRKHQAGDLYPVINGPTPPVAGSGAEG